MNSPGAAPMAQTDYGALLKDTFNALLKTENLVPLIVGALVVSVGSLTIVLAPPLALGWVRTALKVVRGETAKIDDLWSGFRDFGPSFVLALVGGLLIGLGLILLVLPGVVLAFLFSFSMHILAVRPNVGVATALKESLDLVKANPVDVLVLWLVSGVLSALLSWTVIGGFAVAAFTVLLSSAMFVRLDRG